MGLTLHYQGRIRDLARVPELVDEVADICQWLHWPYHLHDEVETVPAKNAPLEPGTGDPKEIWLRGILFTPPACETAILVFGNSRRLLNLLWLEFANDERDYPSEYLYMLHTKTQRTGEDTHVALIMLLKYLEKKYDLELEVHDEGNYWETLDRTLLNERFEQYEGCCGSGWGMRRIKVSFSILRFVLNLPMPTPVP